MIRKTKNKFIIVTMISVVLVLAVLMGVINWLNFADMDERANLLLEFLVENGGRFPMSAAEVSEEVVVTENEASGEPGGGSGEASAEPDGGAGASGEAGPEDASEVAEDTAAAVDRSAGTAQNRFDGKGRDVVPKGFEERYTERIIREVFTYETPYETRYFSVVLGPEGEMISVDITQIAAITSEDAVTMARTLSKAGKTDGYYERYKYLAQDAEEGTLFVFLDCAKDLNSAGNFLKISILVSMAGVAAVLLLVLLFSGWAIKPMVSAYNKQKTFITNAGHELKTPLAVIGSCTEVLELEQGQSKWTEAIHAQVERMSGLTGDLIALARMDENAQLPMAEFDLSAAVRAEAESFQLLAEQRELSLRLDIQPDILYRGSETAIRQLTGILTDNAVKYTSGGEILLSLGRKGRRLLLKTENLAEGFLAGEQPQLFERFYRGDVSHGGETEGYGIGLSIAQSIVLAHGGKISAVSDGQKLIIKAEF